MIIFLYGTDNFRLERQAKKIIEKFVIDRDPDKLNTNAFHGKDCTPEQFHGVCLAMPFLAEKRLTYIKYFFDAPVPVQEKLLTYINEGNFPEFSILVVETNSVPKTKLGKELYAALTKGEYVYNYDLLSGKELEGYIDSLFAEQGRKVQSVARGYIATNAPNLWAASGIISQVVAYSSSEEITLADVKTFLPAAYSETIFSLIDAIVSSHPRPLFSLLERFYQQGNDPGFVLAMLIRQYKLLLQMRDLYEREGVSQSQLFAKRLGQKPFIITKLLPVMKKASSKQLQEMYEALLKMDVQQKTSSGDLGFQIDLFVAKNQLQSRG